MLQAKVVSLQQQLAAVTAAAKRREEELAAVTVAGKRREQQLQGEVARLKAQASALEQRLAAKVVQQQAPSLPAPHAATSDRATLQQVSQRVGVHFCSLATL